jgi:hypothetical protein
MIVMLTPTFHLAIVVLLEVLDWTGCLQQQSESRERIACAVSIAGLAALRLLVLVPARCFVSFPPAVFDCLPHRLRIHRRADPRPCNPAPQHRATKRQSWNAWSRDHNRGKTNKLMDSHNNHRSPEVAVRNGACNLSFGKNGLRCWGEQKSSAGPDPCSITAC